MRLAFREPARARTRSRSSMETFEAPVGGWVTSAPLARTTPRACRVCENFFPETDRVRLRGGRFRIATVADPVDALFAYAGASEVLFAADATSIYDVTSPADPSVIPATSVSGQTSGAYSTQQFATAGGVFLYAVNGADDAQLFDGTSWQAVNAGSTPFAITGVSTSALSFVWQFKSRLFFVEAGTLSVWYLDPGSVSGAATEFDMSALFSKGGSILFGGRWSQDSGSGMDDRWYAVSTEGEVVIYEGANPSDAANWSLVGVFDIGKPLGKNATIPAGGDSVIATQAGMVPLSEALVRDSAALSIAAVSRAIEDEWQREASARAVSDWSAVKWSEGNMLVVSMPVETETIAAPGQVFVANLETGAWGKYTGWNARALCVFQGRLILGVGDEVFEGERGGSDHGEIYTGRLSFHPRDFGAPGFEKLAQVARGVFEATTAFEAKISVATDYSDTFPSPPSVASASGSALWGTAIWGEARWGGTSSRQITGEWQSVSALGFAHALQCQISSSGSVKPDVAFVAGHLTHERGGAVV